MAATAVVSRRMGEKKPEEAADAAFQAILISLVAAALIALLATSMLVTY
jgi:Na+-driven multidrug efflux pump